MFFVLTSVLDFTGGDITLLDRRALFTLREAFSAPEKFLFKILFTSGLTALLTTFRFTMGNRAFMRHVFLSPLFAFWPFKGFLINMI